MRQNSRAQTIAAAVLAALATWRMPLALGLSANSPAFSSHAVSLVIAAGLMLLLKHAFHITQGRLWRCAAVVGALFAAFVLLGEPLRQTGELPEPTLGIVLMGLVDFCLYAAVASAFLVLAYQCVERLSQKQPAQRESLFGKLLGNGFVVFALLMLCWLPVWLAFYPGIFSYDGVTQFFEYDSGMMYPHHPLLHTLFLGACLQWGMQYTETGITAGMAVYAIVQMALLAAMLAYGCSWLRRRKAPLWARACVTALFALFPFYTMWTFLAQKDVLFGGLVLVFVLQLADLWNDGPQALRSPWRVVRFVLTAVLMMLMRNNGIFALLLLLPLLVIWAKGARLRITALIAGSMALYLAVNAGVAAVLEAGESDADVEMLSIPLQQLCRALREDENALNAEDAAYLEELYPDGFTEFYNPGCADPVKWSMESDALRLERLLPLWARVGGKHIQAYCEAFLVQNLPYYLPGAPMQYNYDFGPSNVGDDEVYELSRKAYIPWLTRAYTDYGNTLTLGALPFVRLLSDTAFHVWLVLAAFALAVYRKQKGWMAALGFLLALWLTCLLGPVAIIRYMLGLIYTVPVALSAMLAPQNAKG